jgi:hypothetical protein
METLTILVILKRVLNHERKKNRSKSRGRTKRRTATRFFEELYGTTFSPKRILNNNQTPSPELPQEWEEKFRRDASLQRRHRRHGYITPPELKYTPPRISSNEKQRNIRAFLDNFDSK